LAEFLWMLLEDAEEAGVLWAWLQGTLLDFGFELRVELVLLLWAVPPPQL
jgi:hypothetical protein